VVGHVLHPEGSDGLLTIAEAAAVDDGPGWRLRFREVGNRAAAEPLRDAYLEAVVDRSADLEPGAAYWHEVIGTEVRGLGGEILGAVSGIYRVGEAEVFEVGGGPAGQFDVPVVRDIVRVFAPERGEIVVDAAVLDLGSSNEEPRPRPPRKRPRWSRHGKGGARATPGPDAGRDAEAGSAPPEPSPPEPSPPETSPPETAEGA
jgi:ribosomal 30S subunit maturation factor RimM